MPETFSEAIDSQVVDHPLGISVAEASSRLGLSESVISKLIESGRLRAEKLGKRWYIDPALQIRPSSSASATPRSPQASPPPVSPHGGGDPHSFPFQALRSLPDDHIIDVYRLKQGKRHYVISMTPEEFSLRSIKQTWGGGIYLGVGTSDGQIVAQHQFCIDGLEKDPDTPQPKEIIIPATDPQSLQIQQLAGQVQALQQALMALAAGANSRPQEDGESRKRWLEEMLLMKQALAPPPSPPPPPQVSPEESRKHWLEEVMLLKQVFAQPQQQSGIEAISGALMKGVEMAAAVSSIGEKEGVGTALLKGMLPTLNEVVGGIAKNLLTPQAAPETSPLPHRPPSTSPPASPAAPRQLPGGDNGDGNDEGKNGVRVGATSQQSVSGIKLLLPALKRAARENRDPYPYAVMIASEIPEEAAGQLRAATEEQFRQFAASFDPQLSEYPGWVGELRSALLAEMEEGSGNGGD